MFVKNLISYSGASLVVQAMQLVQGLVVRRMLPPALMGVWNYVGVVQAGAATFDLGITQAAGRELPLLHGAGQRAEEGAVRATAFWSRLVQSLALAGGMLVWAAYAAAHGNGLAWPVAFAGAVLVLLSSCNDSLATFCQSQQRYAALGRSNVFGAVVSAILLPLGAWLDGVRGLVAGAVVALFLQLLQLAWRTHRDGLAVAWTWRWPALRGLLGYGLPMRLVDYPLAVFTIMDVLVVSWFLDASDLAIYSTAKIMSAMAIDIPSRMGNVYLSRLYIQSGANVDRRALGAELVRYLTMQYLVVMPLVICGVYWLAVQILSFFLPKYVAALPAAQVLLLTVFFVPQTSLMRNFWMIDKRFGALLCTNLIGLAGMAVGLGAAVTWFGPSLLAVAWGCVAGYGVFFLSLVVTVGREVLGSRMAMRVAGAAVGAMLYIGLVIGHLRGRTFGGDLVGFVGGSLGQLAGTLALLAPVVAVGVWQGRLPDLWRSLRTKT